MTVWRLKAFEYQNTLTTDLCNFTNYTTSLFCGRDAVVPERSRVNQIVLRSPGQVCGVPWTLFCSLGSLQFAEMVLAPGIGSWCLPPAPESFRCSGYLQHSCFLWLIGLDGVKPRWSGHSYCTFIFLFAVAIFGTHKSVPDTCGQICIY